MMAPMLSPGPTSCGGSGSSTGDGPGSLLPVLAAVAVVQNSGLFSSWFDMARSLQIDISCLACRGPQFWPTFI